MIKITKGMARKLYEEGKEVMIIPSRVRPTGILALPILALGYETRRQFRFL